MSPRAIRRFVELLGEGSVSVEPAELSAAETATYPTSARVPVILRPANAAEVAACVRVAAEEGVALHPVSGGKNHGYGSRAPRVDAALLDLGRLDRILAYDEELGAVTVEPGVTFAALFDFLRARRAPWLAPATSGPPQGSVIGNALERGVGTGPHADRAAFLAGLEVVLGDGRMVRTGGATDGSRLAGLCREGAGPALDGLFFQSNLGVVTRATVWLAPLPEHLQVVFLRLADAARLPALIGALRGVANAGLARPPLSLFNDVRLLSVVRGYPWADTAGATPLPAATLSDLCREHRIDAWSADLSLHGASEAHARCLSEHLGTALRPHVDGWEVVDADRDQLTALLDAPGARHPWLGDPLRRALVLRHAGVPQAAPLLQAYWRKPARPASAGDLEGDRCGLVWCCPLVPFTGSDVARALAIWEETARAFGFEPGISLQALSTRCLHLIGSLLWDRDAPGDDERAIQAARHLGERLSAAGYPPYRTSTATMAVGRADEGAQRALAVIRSALDPAGVLSPGRYA